VEKQRSWLKKQINNVFPGYYFEERKKVGRIGGPKESGIEINNFETL
jgi:hypothetical protein